MGTATELHVRPIVWTARVLSLLVALATPAVYFKLSYSRFTDALAIDAEVVSQLVTRYVNTDPGMWIYEQHRLEGILERDLRPHERQIKRVLDGRGQPAAVVQDDPPPPLVTRAAAIYDAGDPVARVEISRSLRGVLLHTALVGCLSMGLGIAVYWVLNLVPLAALRRTLRALSQEKERAHVTLAAIAEAVVTTDLAGNIGLTNRGAEELSGVCDEEARGRPFDQVFSLRKRGTGEPWAPPWRGGEASRDGDANWVLEDRTGRRHLVTMIDAPLHDGAGNPAGYVVDMRDVSERDRLEREVARAQRLESIGVLAGGIAHDFNNLLMAIVGNIDVSLRDAELTPGVVRRLTAAGVACERARDLTQQLLTFARGGAPVRTTVDLTQLIRETTEFCSRGSSVGVRLDLSPDLWAVEADQGQISQVLQNLVINAHQATRSGGRVAVEAQNFLMEQSENPRRRPGRYVRVTVEDEGVGIAADDVEHIFDPYFTRKSGGSGLGLAVVYSIVTKHGGLIDVESAAGKGARFDVYLPASDLPWEESPAASSAPRAEGGRLLLMDDDDLVREAAAELFSHLGYEVTATRDGKEALERHEEALRASAPFDLAVLDLTVPGGMGGEETARLLRERGCDALLVASSGYSTAGTLADYQARGFDEILSKPYRLEDVLHTFASLASLRQDRSTRRGGASTQRR